MALPDGFGLLTPLGLLALAALVPVVVLYLVQPDPRRRRLPTLQFLLDEKQRDESHPLLERLRRSLLLLIQLLLLASLAWALATPYVAVSEVTTVEETALVVDASASMGTQADGATRFQQAVTAARDDATGTTSVVVSASERRIPLRQGTAGEARETLADLAVAHTEGDLRSAITEAASIVGENARVVVYSDFADDTAWETAVRSARARGVHVDLRQFAGGGEDNVGIVDRSFSGQNVTVTVGNFGDGPAERTVTLGDQERSLSLGAGDVTTATLRVPAGGGEIRLSPGDSFPTDDVAPVTAPADATIDVALVTNDRNRFLATALSVIDPVSLTVESPPTTIEGDYDVIVYSNVQADRLLGGNVEAGEDTVERGGGVAIQAQPNVPERYGDLSLIDAVGTARNPTLSSPASDELTRDVNFPPPEEYVTGDLRTGRALLETAGGTPLLATVEREGGRLLYYGYVEDTSTFKYNYQYPVFWKRAVYYLAGRDPLDALNPSAGERRRFANETMVGTPEGTVTTDALVFDRTGVYEVGGRQLGVALDSERESAVAAESLGDRGDGDAITTRQEARTVPRPITGLVALAALAVALLEVAYLRRRGDL